ncbi:hypothetical protein GMJLKIPL_5482 [Methylobacterium isbiliense]|uniref:DUF2530 domain-containing protein n=1 Tax=Methylobacterium isbiliense TaxID=315478 RepID=A0ABQ4SK13_9HYPH|nr:hypothetical protein GMJLKIPL_5482 [Methylobacterium isbiliense]
MSDDVRLRWASLAFAVLWTGGMLWWSAPLDAVAVVIWLAAGAVAGCLWYGLMSRWQRWSGGPRKNS